MNSTTIQIFRVLQQQQQFLNLLLANANLLNGMSPGLNLSQYQPPTMLSNSQTLPVHQKLLRSCEDSKKSKKLECQNEYCDRSTHECVTVMISDKQKTYCKLCYQNYKDDYFCEYCIQIFDPMDEEEVDEKEWIMCEMCERWNHIDCEASHGINNIKRVKKVDNYYCCKCRQKNPDELIKIQEPKQQVPISFSSQRVKCLPLKISDCEIQEDLEQLRALFIEGSPDTVSFRKTTRRKRQKI